MKSAAFHLTAFGYGRDLVQKWHIKSLSGPFIYNWESFPITIKAVELLVWPSPCWYAWFMVGNSATPDIMLMAHGSQRKAANILLKGFALPAQRPLSTSAYLDLHCRAFGFASVFLNFFYEPTA